MDEQKIIRDAGQMHQDLYEYGKLKAQDNLLLVSGILLALRNHFDVNTLTGNSNQPDGVVLYESIKRILKKIKMKEPNSFQIIMEQFTFLKSTKILNEVNPKIEMTPLKHFMLFLKNTIPEEDTVEDYIGRFYSEFMSYESSEGQTLGIILTPAHVTSLFAELLKITKEDVVLDPCVGTAGFLIAGLHRETDSVFRNRHLYGIEIQHFMFTVSCLNLMIRGCSEIRIQNRNFLEMDANEIRNDLHPTIGMINPPYALGSSSNSSLYEINFIKHLLDAMECGGRVAAIVPTSSMTGKTKEIRAIKRAILERHTLEGVITVNPDTFYGVDTQTVIAVFKAGIPNEKEHLSKFIDFRNDGYEVVPHTGILPTKEADGKRQYLLDVWNKRKISEPKFCAYKHITAEDEWLHSSVYSEAKIPTKKDFEKKATEYLSYRCSNLLQGRKYLFDGQESFGSISKEELPVIDEVNWKRFSMEDVFRIQGTKPTQPKDLIPEGTIPKICCSAQNNGVENVYQNAATEPGDVLTVESATIGSVHYQQVPFSSSSHVEKLMLKNRKMGVYIGLFLATAFAVMVEGRYNYGYKLNKKRMKQQQIMLPVDQDNKPDFKYMEVYMKNIIYNKWIMFQSDF